MNGITQVAGDHAIQFGYIEQAGTISIGGQPIGKNGVLHVQIGSIVGGVVTIAEQPLAPQPRALPVQLGPRPFPLLLGRREEVQVAVNTLPYDQPMEIYGSSGIGKTVLVRYLAHHPAIAPAFPDGMIYHRSSHLASVSDLLQLIFNAFYDSQTPTKLTDIQIRTALSGKKALVLLDGAVLTRDQIQDLINALPSCTFLFVSQARQLWGEGQPVELHGLPLNEAVSLLARELGRTLSPAEQPAAEALCTALAGHPLQILQAAALVREEQRSLAAVAQQVQSAAAGSWAAELMASLQKQQRWLLALLAALGSRIALSAERMADLAQLPEVKSLLEPLLQRHLLQIDSDYPPGNLAPPRYHLVGGLAEELQQAWNLTPWLEQLASYFTQWVQQHAGQLDRLQEETDAILQVLEWAAGAGRWADVLCLGRAIEGVLALSGQWDLWQRVLQWILVAARTLGDPIAEALALHQLGTRALCLHQVTEAQAYLSQALQLREALNDSVGAAATRQNLQFILEPPLPPQSEPTLEPTLINPPGLMDPNLVSKIAAIGLLAVGAIIVLILKTPSLGPHEVSSSPVPSTPSPVSTAEANSTGPSGSDSSSQPPSQPLSQPPAQPLTLAPLVLRPATVPWGSVVTGTVTLSGPAPEEGAVIRLTSSNPPLAAVGPEQVTIEPGHTAASFEVRTAASNPGNTASGAEVVITAAYGSSNSQSATLTIEAPPAPEPLPTLNPVILDPRRVRSGDTATGTITLSGPAPRNGAVITLTSSDPSLATVVPEQLPIAPGNTTARFQISTRPSNSGRVRITASYGQDTRSAILSVEPPPQVDPTPSLSSLGLDDNSVAPGKTVSGSVTLSGPAPSRGAVITLASSDPSLATVVPDRVTIDPNGTTARFEVQAPPSNGGKVKITASYGQSTLSTSLVVGPPNIKAEPSDPAQQQVPQ